MPGVADWSPTKKWALGIVAAIAGTTAAALILQYVNGNPPGARIQVVTFNQNSEVRHGTFPEASIQVHNAGKQTATACNIYWHQGITEQNGGLSLDMRSGQFSVDGGQDYSVTLDSTTAYGFTGTTTATATVDCSNTSDDSGETAVIGIY